MIEIPVRYLTGAERALTDPETTPALPFIRANPCICVGFFFDINVSEGRTNEVNFTRTWALIDTGADDVYVDKTLIETYSPPVAKGGAALTVNNSPGSKAYRGSIFLLENRRTLDMYVIERDFVSENRPFKIVLGRRFLQFCHLDWDGPSQRVRLRVGENNSAY